MMYSKDFLKEVKVQDCLVKRANHFSNTNLNIYDPNQEVFFEKKLVNREIAIYFLIFLQYFLVCQRSFADLYQNKICCRQSIWQSLDFIFTRRHIFDSSKLKEFADNNSKFDKQALVFTCQQFKSF